MDEKTIACPVRDEINEYCSCPKTDCPNHGLCCQCIQAHKKRTDVELIIRFPHCVRDMVQTAIES